MIMKSMYSLTNKLTLIGWQTLDIYQNLNITYLNSIIKNQNIDKGYLNSRKKLNQIDIFSFLNIFIPLDK